MRNLRLKIKIKNELRNRTLGKSTTLEHNANDENQGVCHSTLLIYDPDTRLKTRFQE